MLLPYGISSRDKTDKCGRYTKGFGNIYVMSVWVSSARVRVRVLETNLFIPGGLKPG
jgi:hypothetical protein